MSNFGSEAIDEFVDRMFAEPDADAPGGADAYDERDSTPSDLSEVVGRLAPSAGADPNFGKSPRQIEKEQEAQKEEAGPDAKGSSLLELFGTEGLSDAQLGDMESERAYQAELAEEAEAQELAANPDAFEFPADLVQQAEQHNDYATQVTQRAESSLRDELANIEQAKAGLRQQYAQVEQAYAAAQQAGDQARMQQCQQAAAELQRNHDVAERYAAYRQTEVEATNHALQSETAFRKQHADYDAAFNVVLRAVNQLAEQQYPQLSPEQRAQVIRAAQVKFIRDCQTNGIDMAEAIYQKAVEVGYQPAKPTRKAQAPAQPVQQPKARPTLAQISGLSDSDFELFWAEFSRNNVVMPGGW